MKQKASRRKKRSEHDCNRREICPLVQFLAGCQVEKKNFLLNPFLTGSFLENYTNRAIVGMCKRSIWNW